MFTSKFLVSFLIGLIVISFMFTGMESMKGSPDTIAKVGDHPIKASEFQREYEKQLNFYRQILQGKEPNKKQIEQFGIKRNALNQLVMQKLNLILAEEMGISASTEEITQLIKDMPYFKSNGKFNLTQYKNVLAANRMNPKDFEKSMKDQVFLTTVEELFKGVKNSEGHNAAIKKFQNEKYLGHFAQINKEGLRAHLQITSSERKTWKAEPKNSNEVKQLFESRKAGYSQQEQVKASHILIRGNDTSAKEEVEKIRKTLTAKNFAKIANEKTQDPSGKGSGGDLGWFGKNRMAPEFEKAAFSLKKGAISQPVVTEFGYHLILVKDKKPFVEAKFSKYERKLTDELIRRSKNKELDQFFKDTVTKVEKDFKAKSFSKVKKLSDKLNFSFDKSSTVNIYDGHKGTVFVDQKKIEDFVGTLGQTNFQKFDNAGDTVLVYLENSDEKIKEEKDQPAPLAQDVGPRLQREFVQSLQSKYKVKTFGNLQL